MLKLSNLPSLLPLQPLEQEVVANQPPVINTYTPEVEKWRQQVWDTMPQQMRARPDAGVLLDKAMYAMFYESGGNDSSVGDNGAAWGLYQSHHIPAGSDAQTQIRNMWDLVSKNPDQWTDWGEGATYEGKPFGAFGNHPYNNPQGQTITSSAGRLFSQQVTQPATGAGSSERASPPFALPTINFAAPQEDQETPEPIQGNSGWPTLPKIMNTVGQMDPNVNPETGGVYGGNYGPANYGQGSPFVDQGAEGTLRGELQARRQGKDQLGNALIAGAVAAPMIAAGPAATAIGAVAGEVGHYIDEKTGAPTVNLPIVGELGPFEAASNFIGAKSADDFLNPTKVARAGSPVNPTKPWLNVVKPKIRTPMRIIPGAMSAVGDAGEQYRRLKAEGYDDAAIAAAFGEDAVRSGQAGRNLGVAENAQRIDAEQAANADYFRNRNKRTVEPDVGDDPEKPFIRKSWESMYEGQTAGDVNQGGSVTRNGPDNYTFSWRTGVGESGSTSGTFDEVYDFAKGRSQQAKAQSVQDAMSSEITTDPRLKYQPPPGSKSFIPPEIKDPSNITPEEARKIYEVLDDEARRLDAAGTRSTEQSSFAKDVAYTARILGDPFGELVVPIIRKEGNRLLKAAIEENDREKRTPLQRAIDDELQLGGQGGQMGLSAEGRTDFSDVVQPEQGTLNLNQQKLNKALQQNPSNAEFNPNAVGEDVSQSGLFPGPLFETMDDLVIDPNYIADLSPVKLSPEMIKQQAAVRSAVLRRKFDQEELDRIMKVATRKAEDRPVWKQALSGIGDLISLPRALQTRFDYSYPFRQGLLFARRQKEFWDSFGTGFRSLFDKDFADEAERNYMSAPHNPKSLNLTSWKPGHTLQHREEAFYNKFLEKGPNWLKELFSASERGATVFINKLRSDVTNSVAKKWIREGLDPNSTEFIDDLEVFGNYVNRATGYGNLGDFEKAVGALNQVFYGARLNVSRVQAAGYLFNKNPRIAKEAWKDFGGLVAMGATTLALADMAGAEVGIDPDSADFGKIKVGNTRIDIWGGYQQLARLWYKIADGQVKNPGDFDKLGEAVAPYLGNKLSPQATSVVASGVLGEGTRESLQPIDRPAFSPTEGLSPLAWKGLYDAVREEGAIGGAIATYGLFGGGVQTYESKTDARNKAAKDMGLGKYEDLGPVDRQKVNQSQYVQDYTKKNPSDYDKAKEQAFKEVNQLEKQAEDAFIQGKLTDKTLPEIWRDLSLRRLQANQDLKNQFAKEFKGFDESRFDKAVSGYFQNQVNNPDGTPDFEATEAMREDYISKLKPDEQEWLNEALQANRASKSETHQAYLNYIDQRKSLGYFAPELQTMTSAQRNQKIAELDAQNPEMDAMNWYWTGGVQSKPNKKLNSNEAVNMAIEIDPSRNVEYTGLGRPVNQTDGSMAFWQQYGQRIDNYYRHTVPRYADEFAAKDFNGKKYAQLDLNQQQQVRTKILQQVRNGSPELRAILKYMGDDADANGDYVVDADAGRYLNQFIQQFGNTPVKQNTPSGRPSKFFIRSN